ncbi:hypothetical protein BIV57_01085 [Mangrovactinospora gilvigrisea]|uniref:DUF4352 domain-containing protein n=1 Tax=Mangrovactinospora gilvigrisea TaxID=1428644 RepID=A0A1J7CIJ8_9ACTN|nr:FxLYD domain-containing protein [Mangrovactinospora gilvigrisea]OIV39458.1 hypothetical protein BIV57_01085 [Mangrovactinospora gilvigrisea]
MRTSRKILIGVSAAAVLGIGGCAAATSGSDAGHSSAASHTANKAAAPTSTTAAHPVNDDLTIGAPYVNDVQLYDAKVTITNHTSKASDYDYQLELVDGTGKRLDTTYVSTQGLAPGQTYSDDAGFSKMASEVPSGTHLTVKIVSGDRYAST